MRPKPTRKVDDHEVMISIDLRKESWWASGKCPYCTHVSSGKHREEKKAVNIVHTNLIRHVKNKHDKKEK